MAEQRMALWVAEAELDDDLQDVDPSLAIGNYGQTSLNYDDSTYGHHLLWDTSSVDIGISWTHEQLISLSHQ
jgi:hypothetical protein